MNLTEFYGLLEAHDWTYGKSDDHSAWKKGQAEQDTLILAMNSNARMRQLYNAFHNYVWEGEPKPDRPE